MKVLVLLFAIFVLAQSIPVTLYRENYPGVWIPENVTSPLPELELSGDDVQIYFRNQATGMNVILVNPDDPTNVRNDGFNPRKDTLFVVHGWKNEFDSPVCETIADAVLKYKDINVFIVDWSKIAMGLYINAQASVPGVGKLLGTLMLNLVKSNDLNLDTTFIVGHSLGAHIAGLAGATLEGKVSHIVGLDPALPLFSYEDITKRLDTTDAKFVEIIHTCSGLLGFNKALGHVDYWPNGGRDQPGCGMDLTGSCAHGRSYLYYAESLVSSGFLSKKCNSYDDYKNGKCNNAATSKMGEYNLDKRASGSYYLTTNSDSPYAMN